MKEYIDYQFFHRQILLLIALSLIPGIAYVIFGWIYGVYIPALIWYTLILLVSLRGYLLYLKYRQISIDDMALKRWYADVRIFMFMVFGLWTWIFIIYARESASHLDYIAIFTQLGASVVASALLVSDKKLYIPILLILILPLALYFLLLNTWYGYVLAIFSLIYVGVLLYASGNTYALIQKTAYESTHDVLTGLQNRRFFIEYMEKLLTKLQQKQKYAYMYVIDLDHFKTINDSLGHDIGDKLLQEVATRIDKFSKGTHAGARIGGDEFAMVSNAMYSKEQCVEEASSFAKKLLDIIKQPYIIEGHHLYISASIGISYIESGQNDRDAGTYMKEADIAMYEVKNKGRDGIVQFDDTLSSRIERDLMIEKKLYFALKKHYMQLMYQPIFAAGEKMIGCEVLTRWHDEELGEIKPEIFIKMAEKTGLIIELGNYILAESFKTLRQWEENGHTCEHFAINISARQLIDSDFIEDVKRAIEQYLPQNWKSTIYFEITESILVEDIPKAIRVMGELQRLGIHFAMDDFGTGYSSLSYLRELPVDEIKIDGSFVHHLDSSSEDKTMVITILSIAKTFGLKVVAEGVENKTQYEFLLRHGCDYFQGLYFDKALRREPFEQKYLEY